MFRTGGEGVMCNDVVVIRGDIWVAVDVVIHVGAEGPITPDIGAVTDGIVEGL